MMAGRDSLRIGTATHDITPPLGSDLSGFGQRDGAALGVRDPLRVIALTATDGQVTVSLVTLDLIGLTLPWLQTTRQAVATTTGVPADAQLYACSHTHGGPETGVLPSMGDADPAYLDDVRAACVRVVRSALDHAAPASLALGRASSSVGVNRRAAAVSPHGPADGDIADIDRTVVTAQFRTPDRLPIATIVNYGCHPTSSRERVVSADYPGHLRAAVTARTGAPALFINGAGGDVNLRFDAGAQRGFAAARQHGQTLAEMALTSLGGAPGSTTRAVAAATASATLTYADRLPPAPARALASDGERALAAAGTLSERRRAEHFVRRYAERVLATYADPGWSDGVAVDVQAIRIGDLAVVALPGEVFAADGLAIRRQAPTPNLMLAGWSNGNLGYVPTRQAFAAGGYEVESAFRWYGHPAAWHPVSGDRLRRAARQVTDRLFA